MGETCAVCKKGQGPEKCEVCGFSDNGFINRQFPIPEDTKNWIETVVKPYRAQWEKIEAARHGTFTDPRDGKTYKTIKIGEQVWMAENLAYNAEGSKCYDNNEENGKKYGRLYDWDTAMQACPPGWHLPSDEEWQTLLDFVGDVGVGFGGMIAGKKLKSKNGWNENGNGTDDFGFTALPGGSGNDFDEFYGVGSEGNWWGTLLNDDRAFYKNMSYFAEYVWGGACYKESMHSVRCIKD